MSLQSLTKDELIHMVQSIKKELDTMTGKYNALEVIIHDTCGIDLLKHYKEALETIEALRVDYQHACKQYTDMKNTYDMQCIILRNMNNYPSKEIKKEKKKEKEIVVKIPKKKNLNLPKHGKWDPKKQRYCSTS